VVTSEEIPEGEEPQEFYRAQKLESKIRELG
jgi:hypothetical protein